jgi:hypothetical protein
MGRISQIAAAMAAASLVIAGPARADDLDQAEKVRRLDIMLMVTGLRCRGTADNFQAAYGSFTTAHLRELNAAGAMLRADYTRRHGAAGANRALDRMSTTMANAYGGGHPWLNCAQLGTVARNLAAARGSGPLVEAADQLLTASGTPQLALAQQ